MKTCFQCKYKADTETRRDCGEDVCIDCVEYEHTDDAFLGDTVCPDCRDGVAE